jgi:hypothetical protein
LLYAATGVGIVLLLVGVALYSSRRVVAREALIGWLRAHGVASQVRIDGLGSRDLGGGVRIGDPKTPDLVADDIGVTYGLRGLGIEARSVTLRRPTLRARLHEGRLSFGTLDPLIDALRRRPPRPNTPQPHFRIDGGVLLLATDNGPVRLTIDADLRAGRLISLTARSNPAQLHAGAFGLSAGVATLSLQTIGDRAKIGLDAPITQLRTDGVELAAARLSLRAEAPYPDIERKRLDGAFTLHAGLTSGRVGFPGGALGSAKSTADFRGEIHGGIDDLRVGGVADFEGRGFDLKAGAARAGALQVRLRAGDLSWTRKGGDAVAAAPQVTFQLLNAASGDLRLSQLRGGGRGRVNFAPDGPRGALAIKLGGRGSWAGLGPVKTNDAASVIALKRAAQGFAIAAPKMTLRLDRGGARLALPQPLKINADSGGGLTLTGRADAPILGAGGAGLRLALEGGGLPTLSADVHQLRVVKGAITAEGEAKAAGSFGLAEGATLVATGTLHAAGGTAVFTADRCAPVSVRKLILGANVVERLTAQLCPWRGPMFSLTHGDWRLRAKVAGLAAGAPFLQARIAGGSGDLLAEQAGGRLGVTALLDRAEVLDDIPQKRFNPLRIDGTAKFVDAIWSADFNIATLAGRPLGVGSLRQDTRDGHGGVKLDAESLVFSEAGLQPLQLSPLAAAFGSPAQGKARFAGHFDWTPDGVTSGGTLSINGLDFQSGAGKVSGLRGVVDFTNLAPLTAPPGQSLSADSLATIVPITGLAARFGMDGNAITVAGGEAAVGGGRVGIGSLRIPFSPDAPLTGLLTVEGVQLHDMVAASAFADRVDLDAKVSGRIPFWSQGGKVQIEAAELHSIQPGRLSINRQALTGVAATGSVSAPTGAPATVAANDTFTDFAYQAMENLAFDKLDAAVASRPNGRLGVIAHIVGRHDPPKHQEIRLSLFDLIGRKFLNRPLPLPSDTKVDLTLDTTLNLDDLLVDYADYQQLRSSRAVQPAARKVRATSQETPQ